MTKQDHTRFVQAVRYSPDGNLFASGGFDGKVFIYNGLTSDLVGELGPPAHQGGVYGVCICSLNLPLTAYDTCLMMIREREISYL